MKRVESLLERQVHLLENRGETSPQSYSTNQDTLSQRHPSSLSSSSPWTDFEAAHSEASPSTVVGTILVSEGGYERFVPGLASSDADAINELISSPSGPPMSSNFPFSDDAHSSKQALLDALPPFRQCDELKDIFFEVFSPVSFSEFSLPVLPCTPLAFGYGISVSAKSEPLLFSGIRSMHLLHMLFSSGEGHRIALLPVS